MNLHRYKVEIEGISQNDEFFYAEYEIEAEDEQKAEEKANNILLDYDTPQGMIYKYAKEIKYVKTLLISENIFYKYQPIYADDHNYALSNLKNNILYFKDPAMFNDPFDCKMYVDNKGTKEQWTTWFDKNGYDGHKAETEMEKFIKWEDGLISPNERNYFPVKVPAVCCFSKREDAILMWSHYADSHKGICLRFKATVKLTEHPMFRGVKNYYTIPLYIQDSEKKTLVTGIFKEVDYDAVTIPLIKQFGDPDSNLEVACKQLFIKHSDWHYENEYRIINPDPNPAYFRNRRFEYQRECLEGVIFGCKIIKKNAQLVYDEINKNNLDEHGNEIIINYYKAKESMDKYKINIELIPNIDKFINDLPSE